MLQEPVASSPARARTPRTEQRKSEVVTSEGNRERVAQSPTPAAVKKPVARALKLL